MKLEAKAAEKGWMDCVDVFDESDDGKQSLDIITPTAYGTMACTHFFVCAAADEDDSCFENLDPSTGGKQKRRLARNAREAKRSKRITHQIEQLRNLLRASGRPVKTSKASVLSETADFIRDLQMQQLHLEVAIIALFACM